MRFSKNVFLLLLIALLICSASAAQAARKRADFPPVLMYHDVRETALNYFDVTTEDFAAQLDRLKADGYQTLSMEEFVAIVKAEGKFPEKSVRLRAGFAGAGKAGDESHVLHYHRLIGLQYGRISLYYEGRAEKNGGFPLGVHRLPHPHPRPFGAD